MKIIVFVSIGNVDSSTTGAALFYLKRIDKLDMITEKIPILEKLNMGDRIEGIKEKVSDIRNR